MCISDQSFLRIAQTYLFLLTMQWIDMSLATDVYSLDCTWPCLSVMVCHELWMNFNEFGYENDIRQFTQCAKCSSSKPIKNHSYVCSSHQAVVTATIAFHLSLCKIYSCEIMQFTTFRKLAADNLDLLCSLVRIIWLSDAMRLTFCTYISIHSLNCIWHIKIYPLQCILLEYR